jgi:flagellar assembly protein FliH
MLIDPKAIKQKLALQAEAQAALLKQQQAQQFATSKAKAETDTTPPPPPPVPYSPQTVAQGLLPERRTRPTSDERRLQYRRLEDRELITKAEEEAEWIKEQARQQGYQEGLEQAENDFEELRQQLDKWFTLLDDMKATLAKDLLPLAYSLAESILKTQATVDSDLVLAWAKQLLKSVDDNQKQVIIKVHPSHVPALREAMKAMAEDFAMAKREVMIKELDELDTGACILETPAGQMDASLSTQLVAMQKLLGLANP